MRWTTNSVRGADKTGSARQKVEEESVQRCLETTDVSPDEIQRIVRYTGVSYLRVIAILGADTRVSDAVDDATAVNEAGD